MSEGKAADPQQAFRQAWVLCLMDNLTASVPEPALRRAMEGCGRGCARRNAGTMIERAKGDLDALLAMFAADIGPENARRENGEYHLRYRRCYCPMVSAGPDRLPDAWCECGRGFVLEVFGAVSGKPVSVDLTHSIRRGDTECRFVVRV